MKRRMAVIIVSAIGLSSIGSAAQAILANTTASQYWGCAVIERVDTSLCLKNPLPERLPLPDVPSVPVPGVPA